MPRPCTVCRHPRRLDIDRALTAGVPLASLAREHHLSTSALSRHHRHLYHRLRELIPLMDQHCQQEWQTHLNNILQLVVRTAHDAADNGRHDLVIKSAREAASLVKIMQSLKVTLSPLAAYHLIHSPNFVSGGLLGATPEIQAAERRSLAENFLTSCDDCPSAPETDTVAYQEAPPPDSTLKAHDAIPSSDASDQTKDNLPAAPPGTAPVSSPDHCRPDLSTAEIPTHNGIFRDDLSLLPDPDRELFAHLPDKEELYRLLDDLFPHQLPPLRQKDLPERYKIRPTAANSVSPPLSS